MTCTDSKPTIRKLNIQTHLIIMVSQYPSGYLDANCRTPGTMGFWNDIDDQFHPQKSRLMFSPDFRKMMFPLGLSDAYHGNGSDVGYYDLDTNKVVNVSKIVHPATGDFDQESTHEFASFTDDGLFQFYEPRTQMYKLFDTNTKTIVGESKQPSYSWFMRAAMMPDKFGEYGEPNFVTCSGLWVANDTKYIVERHDDQGGDYFALTDIQKPAGTDCDDMPVERLTPSGSMVGVATDRTGDQMVFTVQAKDGLRRAYQVNRQDPLQPIEVPLGNASRTLLGGFIGWQ